MIPVIIGISSGLLLNLVFDLLKQVDKKTMYGLILSGIGFLYVGFAWTDLPALIVNSVQAVLFVLVAYYGIRKNIYILAMGYFLHGLWDLAYSLFQLPDLIPPHYDLFCLSIDFTIGIYLFIYKFRLSNIRSASQI